MQLRTTACLVTSVIMVFCFALVTQAGKPPRDPEPCFDVPFMFGNTVVTAFAESPGKEIVPFRLPASDMTLADFTGDQVPDIASIALVSDLLGFSAGLDWFSFHKANGDGTFAPAAQDFLLALPNAVTANDFNGDGHLDVAISHIYNSCCTFNECCPSGQVPNPPPTGPMVLVLMNDGTGNFTALPAVGPAARLLDLASGDLTGDGRPEIVACFMNCDACGGCADCPVCPGCDAPLETPKAYVLWNDGSGQFPSFAELPTSMRAKSVAVSDIDGDLDNDVVVGTANGNIASKLELFRNNGGGSFAPRQEFALVNGLGVDKIDLADIDDDDDLDAVIDFASPFEQKQGLALNNGSGVFSPPTVIPLGRPDGIAQFVADVTGDGRPDILTSVGGPNISGAGAYGDEFVVLANTGGAFAAPVLYHAGSVPTAFGAGDINGDRVTDVVVSDNGGPPMMGGGYMGGCTVFAGAGGGQFFSDHIYPLIPGLNQGNVAAWALRAGDLDHDSDVDLIGCRGAGNDGVARVLFNDGAGAFTFGPTVATGDYLNRMVLTDLDDNGALDLVVLLFHDADPYPCRVQVHMGLGNGAFGPTVQDIDIIGSAIEGDIDAADVNGDGWIDVVASPAWEEPIAVFGGPPGPPMRVNVLLNNGAGSLLPPTAYAVSAPVNWQPGQLTPRGLRDAAIGDLNGDKLPDIATVIDFGRKLSLLMNNGDGTFGPFTTYVPSSTNPTGVAMGDMDDDGDLDVVTANRGESNGGHSFSIFLNDGSGVLAQPTDWPIIIWNGGASRWELVLADLDGDGALDAAVSGFEDVSIRLGAGDGTLLPEIVTASAMYAFSSLLAADLNNDGRLDLAAGTRQRSTADPSVRCGVSIMLNHSCAAAAPCPADINNSGAVDVDDLIAVILGWGPCGKAQSCAGDVNNSGAVDVDDLISVILGWGPCS
jgi:hypothetical protein